MSDDDPVREQLSAERQRLGQRLRELTEDFDSTVAASLDSNADDEHDPEGATIAFERSQVTSLARQVRRRLADVDTAEQRLEEGTYGRCLACRGPIAPARLEARPAAALCIGCASGAPRRGE